MDRTVDSEFHPVAIAKHTPGPWSLVADPWHYGTLSTVIAGERQDKKVSALSYQMQVEIGGWDVGAQEANARLIAAAPELLEACKALLDVLGQSYATQTPVPVNCPEAAQAHAAISKAIGA